MEIYLAFENHDILTLLRWDVNVVLVGRKVARCYGEVGLQQPLVDGAELAHIETCEVDSSESVLSLVDQEAEKAGTELRVREREFGQGGSIGVDIGFVGEETAVVWRNVPFGAPPCQWPPTERGRCPSNQWSNCRRGQRQSRVRWPD